MESLLTAALDYAALGWKIIPLHTIADGKCTCGRKCKSPGKHPRTPRGLTDASKDAETIRRWWTEWPDANIGVVLGPSGLAALDLDRHGAQDGVAVVEATFGWTPGDHDGPLAQTGGGGLHALYAGAEGLATRTIADGVELRAGQSYIVLPPSLHESGKRYQWVAHPELMEGPLPALPDWALNGSPTAKSAPGDDEYALLLSGVVAGDRNNAAIRLVGHYLRIGIVGAELLALMIVWNAHNRPPLERPELEELIERIARKHLLEAGEPVKAPESHDEREAHLEAIRQQFNIAVERIVRVGGDEPYYEFTVSGKRGVIFAQDMVSELAWQRAMTAVAEHIPKPLPRAKKGTGPAWRMWSNRMMAAAEHVQPGEDATIGGQLREWLAEFLTRQPAGEDGNLADATETHTRSGHIFLSGPRFRRFIWATFDVRITPQTFAQMLVAEGFEPAVLRVKTDDGMSKTGRFYRAPVVTSLESQKG